MITINLLPPEERKKKRDLSLPELSTVYFIGAAVLFFGIILTLGFVQHHRVSELEGKIIEAKKESKELAPQLARIKKISREREEVDRRLHLITSLDKYRYYRVRLLNDIGVNMPSNCWLTGLTEQSQNSFLIDGVAFSNYKVADIITNLEKSPIFTKVGLTIAERAVIKEREVMKFTLNTQAMPH